MTFERMKEIRRKFANEHLLEEADELDLDGVGLPLVAIQAIPEHGAIAYSLLVILMDPDHKYHIYPREFEGVSVVVKPAEEVLAEIDKANHEFQQNLR